MGVDIMKRGPVLDLEPDAGQFQLQSMTALGPHAGIGLLCRGLQGGGNELHQIPEFRDVDPLEQIIRAGIKGAIWCRAIGQAHDVKDTGQHGIDLGRAGKVMHARWAPASGAAIITALCPSGGSSSFQPVRVASRSTSSRVSRSRQNAGCLWHAHGPDPAGARSGGGNPGWYRWPGCSPGPRRPARSGCRAGR